MALIHQGGHRRIVEVAEYALLGNLEYPDDHRLLQIGVVLESLHHEAADETYHLIVEAAGVGGVQGSIILVQQDVDRFVIGRGGARRRGVLWLGHSPGWYLFYSIFWKTVLYRPREILHSFVNTHVGGIPQKAYP